MDPEERNRQLDSWLDETLSHYNDAEPQWGFEQRILAKVRGAEERRWHLGWFWVPAVLGVAIAIAVLLNVRGGEKQKVMPIERATSAQPNTPKVTPETEPQKAAVAHPREVVRRVRNSKSAENTAQPRQAVFPTPSPLTDEERALVAFAQSRPRQTERLAKSQQQSPEEQVITIQAIRIEPIEAGVFGGGKK